MSGSIDDHFGMMLESVLDQLGISLSLVWDDLGIMLASFCNYVGITLAVCFCNSQLSALWLKELFATSKSIFHFQIWKFRNTIKSSISFDSKGATARHVAFDYESTIGRIMSGL